MGRHQLPQGSSAHLLALLNAAGGLGEPNSDASTVDPVLEVVAFTAAHGQQGAGSAHTCLRFMDYVLSVPTAAARAMLADVALVPLDGVLQLNATLLGAQGAEGCFALQVSVE